MRTLTVPACSLAGSFRPSQPASSRRRARALPNPIKSSSSFPLPTSSPLRWPPPPSSSMYFCQRSRYYSRLASAGAVGLGGASPRGTKHDCHQSCVISSDLDREKRLSTQPQATGWLSGVPGRWRGRDDVIRGEEEAWRGLACNGRLPN